MKYIKVMERLQEQIKFTSFQKTIVLSEIIMDFHLIMILILLKWEIFYSLKS